MYHLDPNINTALERQAEQVRAVQAYGTRPASGPAPEAPAAGGPGRTDRWAGKLTLALVAATPIVVVVAWGLSTR